MRYGAGAASLKTAVCASGVSMSVSSRKVAAPRGWTFFSTSRTENFTSALVKGWPSWNVTPFCSVKVMVLPSGLTFHDCASPGVGDRKSTRLNSSHVEISYAVFCLKKKMNNKQVEDQVATIE